MVGDSNGETNFLHKLLLTNTQVSNIRKAFANNSSANKIFLKTQLFKMIKLETFFTFTSYVSAFEIGETLSNVRQQQ